MLPAPQARRIAKGEPDGGTNEEIADGFLLVVLGFTEVDFTEVDFTEVGFTEVGFTVVR